MLYMFVNCQRGEDMFAFRVSRWQADRSILGKIFGFVVVAMLRNYKKPMFVSCVGQPMPQVVICQRNNSLLPSDLVVNERIEDCFGQIFGWIVWVMSRDYIRPILVWNYQRYSWWYARGDYMSAFYLVVKKRVEAFLRRQKWLFSSVNVTELQETSFSLFCPITDATVCDVSKRWLCACLLNCC